MHKLINFFKERKSFFYATAALIGTMVGVGIFGIPLSFAKAGFFVGFAFMILVVFATIIIDYMYGEIILRTEDKHQLVGYADRYLGKFAKMVVFFAISLSIFAALLAYVVIAGDFLNNLLSPFFSVSSSVYSIFFWAILSFFIFLGLKRFSVLELVLAVLFVVVILIIFVAGIPKIDLNNFKGVATDLQFLFLPYGVLLFAFAGLPAIPIQRAFLKGREGDLKKSILVSVLLVAALYLIFAFSVVGVSGDSTSPDFVSGLFEFLGGKIIFLGSLFGVVAVSSGYLMLGSALHGIFNFDFKVKKSVSWLLVVVPPLALFLVGMRNFIDIISLAGTVAIGIEYIVLFLIFSRVKRRGDRVPEYSLYVPKWLLYGLIALFSAGAIYSLFIKCYLS